MNHHFPTVKTYSTKWQRSYRLYQEKDKLFDAVQGSTMQSAKDDKDSQCVQSGSLTRPSTCSNGKFPLRGNIKKSPKRISRPTTSYHPHNSPVSSNPMTGMSLQRPATVAHAHMPTGSPMIIAPLRRHGVPTVFKADAKRPKAAKAVSPSNDFPHSPPKVLRVETLLRYRPEHAEKAYLKNDSYIRAWLQGVEAARVESLARRARYSQDSESSIELLRETQAEHPALTRKNSANELLKDMMKAFKSSSMERSSELSNIREQPSLPEKPVSPTPVKHVISIKSGKPEEKTKTPVALKKSKIPCLSASYKSSRTTSYDESAYQSSTPTVTRTNDSSNTYTYKWTVGSSSGDVTHSQRKTQDSPSIWLTDKQHKKLNSTTRPKAKSLGKVEFSQCLSPILNEADERRKPSEITPKSLGKRSSTEKENVVPRKQKYEGAKTTSKLAPKASTLLFTSQTINIMRTPDVSSIRLDKVTNQKSKIYGPVCETTNQKSKIDGSACDTTNQKSKIVGSACDATKKTFNFEAVEKDVEEKNPVCEIENKNCPVPRPIITSTPDSQHKYIRPELLLLEDLSSVAPPSAFEDELIPLRTSGYEVNSEEIVCASDLDLEVDIPQIEAIETPEAIKESKQPKESATEESPLNSTYTVTPARSIKDHNTHKNPDETKLSQPLFKWNQIKKTEKTKKTPVMSLTLTKVYPNSSRSQRSSVDSCHENGKTRWRYFSRSSQSFSMPERIKDKKKSLKSRNMRKIPPCSIVAVQNIQVKPCGVVIPVKINSKTVELMSEIKKALPDDIMTTAKMLSLQVGS